MLSSIDFIESPIGLAKSKKHKFKETILTISKLFNELLVIYKYKFSTELLQLFVPRIDIIKIELFKEVILALIKEHSHINKLQTDFHKEYLTMYSLKPTNSPEITYLLLKKYWLKILEPIITIERQNKRKLIFYGNNWLTSLSKQKDLFANSELNPNTIKTIIDNLLPNIKNFLNDLIVNNGYVDIKTNNSNTFVVGKNLATTKGQIIYQNNIMELIQYFPTTLTTYKAPILFVPPCINKYYILDLSPNNSIVKWLVNQGFTVYMISWINPDAAMSDTTFSDYIINGSLQAINYITKTNKSPAIHLAGYCMGGTILSCTLSYMQKTNDPRILSASHFMSLLDFSNFKDLNEHSLNLLEKFTNKTGYLSGRLLSMAFNIVHANELIWPYFINYYLLNKPLTMFDALYWNCDPINLPAAMYNFYLRSICLQNKLRQPNAIEINGVTIELNKVTVPIFSVAAEQDRISQWEVVYEGFKLYTTSCNQQFVLSTSGHVMGLINSPTDHKCSYKTSSYSTTNNPSPNNAMDWLENSTEYSGSWWTCWVNWLTNIDSSQVKAIDPNNKTITKKTNITVSKDAPGDYVLKKIK